MLDYAKKNPGKLRVAYRIRGISLPSQWLLIFKKAGVEVIEVFYKGHPNNHLGETCGCRPAWIYEGSGM
jgi:hypothetical protein